jgi:hypothetical protein
MFPPKELTSGARPYPRWAQHYVIEQTVSEGIVPEALNAWQNDPARTRTRAPLESEVVIKLHRMIRRDHPFAQVYKSVRNNNNPLQQPNLGSGKTAGVRQGYWRGSAAILYVHSAQSQASRRSVAP